MYRRICLRAAAVCTLSLVAISAQSPKPSSPSTNTGASNNGLGNLPGSSGSRGTLGNTPTSNNPTNNTGGFDQSRPIFLSGNVMFDDGRAPNSDIRIERVCSGSSHLETHTDSKGHFSFQMGGEVNSSIADADASNDSFGSNRNQSTGVPQSLGGNGPGLNNQNLLGCDLRAAYPGYVSESVDISMRHSLDDPKLGTILLHHLGNVKGTTISVTTSQAPKSAQKSFEKGNQLVQKGKLEEAATRFESATTDYPKFAAAWFALGQLQQRLNKPEEAKKSYLAAADADSHYVSPFDQLALVAAQQGKWDEAAKYSQTVIDLNPVEFPSSFWYNALANYNLKNNAAAEKSARSLVKLDSRHKYPQVETLLAEFAASRGDLDDAAAHLKAFLAEDPDAKNADLVKSQLARLELARATQAKSTPQPVAH